MIWDKARYSSKATRLLRACACTSASVLLAALYVSCRRSCSFSASNFLNASSSVSVEPYLIGQGGRGEEVRGNRLTSLEFARKESGQTRAGKNERRDNTHAHANTAHPDLPYQRYLAHPAPLLPPLPAPPPLLLQTSIFFFLPSCRFTQLQLQPLLLASRRRQLRL